VRPDVAVKICVDHSYITISWPASSSSSSSAEATYQFYKKAKKTIQIDIEAIESMVELFLQADHRLGDAFRDHFIQSCLCKKRIERAFGFPHGWNIHKAPTTLETFFLTTQEDANEETKDR
jgi:hypothetical protein